MADEWYFMKNGRKIGPLSSKAIVDLAASGKLLSTDSVQKKGSTNWQEASAVKGLFPKVPTPAREAIPVAGPVELPLAATSSGELSQHPMIPSPTSNVTHEDTVPKYKYLDWYIASSRTIARVIFALIAVTGLYPILLVFGLRDSEHILVAFGITLVTFAFTTIVGYLFYMIQMAGADFLSVIRDIEANTRSRTADSDAFS